ncbi:MAG: PilT/PilU family type 4a pilus ATPase [Nanoarchaeota archaeon]|nr:PilT/PilU family type 4a pilus ATPase [Nanoarchaeota archaeon]
MGEEDSLIETSDNKEIRGKLERILLGAREAGASDVHFKVGYKPIWRIAGKLTYVDTEVIDSEKISEIAKLILKEPKEKYFHEHKNVDSSLELVRKGKKSEKDKIYRHRINLGYASGQPFIAIRIIPDEIIPIEKIGFPFEVWKNITGWKDPENKENIPGLKRGLVLITGITGSGKTTTLASLIQKINETRHEHIITLEDPVEYMYNPLKSIISQREIGVDLDSFGEGVKYSLRQDPDIILVGEIRDRETALHALEAAETGHIVFSTLHTKNAGETVRRYVNLFEAEDHDNIRNSLAANLAYVLSQQLIPYQKGVGRRLAMEVMNVKDSIAIKKHLREGDYHKIFSEIQLGQKYKMITMDDHIKQLYKEGKGEVSKEDAISQAHDPEKMREFIDKLA